MSYTTDHLVESDGMLLRWWMKPWFLFLLAAVVRIVAMVALRTWEFSDANNHWAAGWESGQIAHSLSQGLGFALENGRDWDSMAPTAWLAPVYPFLLAVVFSLFEPFGAPSLIVAILGQIVCSAASVVLVAKIGQAVGSPKAGLLAAYGVALAPSSINMSVRIIWGTTLLTLECLALVLLFLHQRQHGGRARAGVLGLVIGVTLLTSPTPSVFIGAAAVWLLLCRGKQVLPELAIMTTISILFIAPWLVRNHSIFASWFLVKSNFQNELFIGNHHGARGLYVSSRSVAAKTLDAPTMQHLATLDEVGRSAALGAVAREWIRDHPREFLGLTAERVGRYWFGEFITDWNRLPLGGLKHSWAVGYSILDKLLLFLAFLGFLCRLRSSRWMLLRLLLLTYPLAYYITHVGITRYRFPVVPLVFLPAAAALVGLQQQLQARFGRPVRDAV